MMLPNRSISQRQAAHMWLMSEFEAMLFIAIVALMMVLMLAVT